MKIDILLDEELLVYGIPRYISWDTAKASHCIIIGSTGSGKTYFSKLLLSKISKYMPDSQLYICDYKGDEDFHFLENTSRFFRYTNCQKGLQLFYDTFLLRQSKTVTSKNAIFLFFDEWASYLNSLEKKTAEEEKKKMATLLMLGRSFNVHVIISQQRADAQYFASARDNLNLCIGLGNLSEESKEMFFSSYKKEMKPNRQRGTGYMLINGTDLKAIQVPLISDFEKLHTAIKLGIIR